LIPTTYLSESLALSSTLSPKPTARVFANFIARKLSPLTDVEIVRLTDNEISRLIHKLPEPEIHRLILDQISNLSELFATIGKDIYREFSNDFTMFLWSE
jgi:hypothetical protein